MRKGTQKKKKKNKRAGKAQSVKLVEGRYCADVGAVGPKDEQKAEEEHRTPLPQNGSCLTVERKKNRSEPFPDLRQPFSPPAPLSSMLAGWAVAEKTLHQH